MKRPPVRPTAAVVLVAATLTLAFWPGTGFEPGGDDQSAGVPTVSVNVVDETGNPVVATVAADGVSRKTSPEGAAPVPLRSGPALAVVSAPGFIPEPVPLGLEDIGRAVPVRLLSDHGGKRFVLHSAGDVMFGRRYQDGAGPLIPPADAARGASAVVDAVAPAFRLADLRTVNLETVVSAAPPTAAYPGKRFILESPPATTEGLRRLGVDVPVLANNHTRDFQDTGVADTTKALTSAGFPIVGLANGDQPQTPYHTQFHGTAVAMLAYTSVDGTFVNDQYPLGDADPGAHNDTEAWQYEARHWHFGARVRDAARNIGEAWHVFSELEPKLPVPEAADMWKSITQVYPELQDWVARRGHAGAAPWNPRTSPGEIAAAKAGLTIVQLHSGFQFQAASAKSTRAMARAAIDAGANIVICHHPHVMQGFEWYKGHLIAYSMGNFVFDQDFLATFSSSFLRTVWEGNHLVDARLVPVEIDGYRPMVATGAAARRTLNGVWASGLRDVQADRDDQGRVWTSPMTRDPDSRPAQFRMEHGTARLTADPAGERPVPVTIGAHSDAPIAFDGLIRPKPQGPADLSLGRELFGWGHFDDDTVDGVSSGATHWPRSAGAMTGTGGLGEAGYLVVNGKPAHPVARIPLPRHREESPDGTALDPEPVYTVRAKVRTTLGTTPLLRVVSYHFDDTDPTEDPESRVLRTLDRTIAVPSDGRWHEISFALSPAELDQGGLTGNMVLLYAGPQETSSGHTVNVDDLEFVEWRPATTVPDEWDDYDYVRNPGADAVTATFRGLPNQAGA